VIGFVERWLNRVDWALSRFAAAVILATMVMMVCDVLGRYLFSHPLPWVYDVVSIYVMNIALYCMASEVLRTQSHIELDIEVRLLPPRAWSVLQAIAWLAVAAVLALTTWIVFGSMLESWGKREVHPGLYEWPVWLEKAIVAGGLALLTLRILVRCTRFVQQGLDASIFNADESAAVARVLEAH
jgi:TRAP-type C4-dicarboxylate transport system permease small subunit